MCSPEKRRFPCFHRQLNRKIVHSIFLIAVLLTALGCRQATGQHAKIIGLEQLQAMMKQKTTEVHIINFWATWCGPCVKELPYFEKVTAEGNPQVKVTLVSLDLDLDPDPEKVYRFISRKNLQSQVVILEAADPNKWIDAIEKEWSGSLPATIVINHRTGERKFIGRALREDELEQYIKPFK